MTSSPFEAFNVACILEAFGASLRWIWHRATVAPSSGQRGGRGLGLTVVAHRLDEDILVVPFDDFGKATFGGRPEGCQRVFECVRFVESKRRIMPAPGLLDEALEWSSPAISQTCRSGESEPRGILDRPVEIPERQQSRLPFHKTREIPSPDTARIVLGQPRIDEQPSVFGQPVPRSPEEFRKVEMMHGVEGGHEVVSTGLEFETFGGRLRLPRPSNSSIPLARSSPSTCSSIAEVVSMHVRERFGIISNIKRT